MLRLAAGAARKRSSAIRRGSRRHASSQVAVDRCLRTTVHRVIRGDLAPRVLTSLGLFADGCQASKNDAEAERDFVAIDTSVTVVDQPWRQSAHDAMQRPVDLMLPLANTRSLDRLPYAAHFTNAALAQSYAIREQHYRFCIRGDGRNITDVYKQRGLKPRGGDAGHLRLDSHRLNSQYSNFTSMTTCPGVAHYFGFDHHAEYAREDADDVYSGQYHIYLGCAIGGVKLQRKYDTRLFEHEISYPGGIGLNDIVGYRVCKANKKIDYTMLDIASAESRWTDYGDLYISRTWLSLFPNETVNAVRTMLMHPNELPRFKQEQQRGLSSC